MGTEGIDEDILNGTSSLPINQALLLLVHKRGVDSCHWVIVEGDCIPQRSPHQVKERADWWWIKTFLETAAGDGTIQPAPANPSVNGVYFRTKTFVPEPRIDKKSFFSWAKANWRIISPRRHFPIDDSNGYAGRDLLVEMLFPEGIPSSGQLAVDLGKPFLTAKEALELIFSSDTIDVQCLDGYEHMPSYSQVIEVLKPDPILIILSLGSSDLKRFYQDRLKRKTENEAHEELKAIHKVFQLFKWDVETDKIKPVIKEESSFYNWKLDTKSFVTWVCDNKTKIEGILNPSGLEIYRPEFFNGQEMGIVKHPQKVKKAPGPNTHRGKLAALKKILDEELTKILSDEKNLQKKPADLIKMPTIQAIYKDAPVKPEGKNFLQNIITAVRVKLVKPSKRGCPKGTKHKKDEDQTKKSTDAVDPTVVKKLNITKQQ